MKFEIEELIQHLHSAISEDAENVITHEKELGELFLLLHKIHGGFWLSDEFN